VGQAAPWELGAEAALAKFMVCCEPACLLSHSVLSGLSGGGHPDKSTTARKSLHEWEESNELPAAMAHAKGIVEQ